MKERFDRFVESFFFCCILVHVVNGLIKLGFTIFLFFALDSCAFDKKRVKYEEY